MSDNSVARLLSNSGKSILTDEDNSLLLNLPGVNLPEKILFVLDTARERNCTPFKLSTGARYSPLFMIKRVVENFVYIKSTIQRNHEYALMILNSQGAQWICDFTNDTKNIVNHLGIIDEDVLEEDQKPYDFDQPFEKIQSRLSSLLTKKQRNTVPAFVIRVILIYSRSHSIPQFYSGKKYLDKLAEYPYFFMDALYVHEPPCSENFCEEIYSQIATAAADSTNFSYILEVGRNVAKLHDNMAKLLAHPLQRPSQKDACYAIHIHDSYASSGSPEIYSNV